MKTSRTVIITSQYRDLYYGEINASDKKIAKTKAVRVTNCRHIGYWKCDTKGGLTSLAVKGPTNESRIGAATNMLITGVAHVLEVSEEAQAKFAAVAND